MSLFLFRCIFYLFDFYKHLPLRLVSCYVTTWLLRFSRTLCWKTFFIIQKPVTPTPKKRWSKLRSAPSAKSALALAEWCSSAPTAASHCTRSAWSAVPLPAHRRCTRAHRTCVGRPAGSSGQPRSRSLILPHQCWDRTVFIVANTNAKNRSICTKFQSIPRWLCKCIFYWSL